MTKKLIQPKPESVVTPVSPDAVAFTEGFAPKSDSIIIADPDKSISDLFKLVDALTSRINAIAEIIKQNYGRVI